MQVTPTAPVSGEKNGIYLFLKYGMGVARNIKGFSRASERNVAQKYIALHQRARIIHGAALPMFDNDTLKFTLHLHDFYVPPRRGINWHIQFRD